MNLPKSDLDDVDFTLMALLQKDGRLSNAKLAEQVALSETPCWRRLKRLEADGYIEGYQAVLSRKKLGYGVLAFVQIGFGSHIGEAPLRFEEMVRAIPEVLSCHNLTGECDYLLQVVAEDLETFGIFVRDVLRELPGVSSIRSSLSLREVKMSGRLPVEAGARR
ncbi:Lrp/AsnC family transcriptional regulator [Chromobacterium piscinae]|uniref:Lrp/AsnC family transcriptional regulator n=1 Tax=Chromobacterium piscinae TaxID=686831 RepID=UPI003207A577